MTVRVVIVDDHAVVRAGLRLLLDAEDDIETVGEAGDAREAVFEVRAQRPDVVLMDVALPGKSGIEAIPDVLIEMPEMRGTRALDGGRPALRAGGVRSSGLSDTSSKRRPTPKS